MDKKTWYKCDPDKNVECNKRGCMMGDCMLTSKKEYSLDGIPMKILKTDKGFKLQAVE
jgi:hypothetical protein